MAGDDVLARVRSAFNPALTARLGEFEDAVAAFQAIRPRPVVAAFVGLVPGAGRSTVAALTALSAAAYSDRQVIVIDTSTTPPAVTELLGGNAAAGRLPALLEGSVASGVPRRRVRTAFTPGAAASVLSLAPGSGEFTPQMLEQTLDRLRHRADLILIDTPPGPSHPVLHAVLDLAEHFLMVVRADGNAEAQVAAAADWLTSAPGRRRQRPASVVAVSRGLRALPPSGAPVTVLHRDEALRRRRLDRICRRSAITGLQLATLAAATRT